MPLELEPYRPVYRLLKAHWITMTEARSVMTILDIYQAAEALDCWEEAEALANAAPPPKK